MTSVGRGEAHPGMSAESVGRTCLVWSNIITDCIRVDASSRDHDGGERVRERAGRCRAGLRVEMGAEGILSGGKAQRRERALQTGTQNPGQSGLGTGENRISGSETHQHGSIRVGGDDCGDGGWVVPPPPVGEGRTVHHRPPGHHGRGWGAKWHPKRRWRWVCGSGVRGSGDTEGKHVVGGGGGGANYRFRRAGGPPIHDVLNGREAGGKTDGSETQGQWKRRDDSLVFDLGTTGVERDWMWKQKTTTMREKGRGQLL